MEPANLLTRLLDYILEQGKEVDPRGFKLQGYEDFLKTMPDMQGLPGVDFDLRDEGDHGAEIGQDLFNVYVSALDHALRELGVGDVSVGKKMRKLGEALYGRMAIYEPALRDGDAEALAASLARNVYESEIATTGTALAAFALSSRARLAEQTLDAVVGAPAWAEIAA